MSDPDAFLTPAELRAVGLDARTLLGGFPAWRDATDDVAVGTEVAAADDRG
jgi:hypothetical protein